MEWLAQPETWISLLTLAILEIVLGIDNIIFISILSGKLPEGQRAKARQWGLAAALITRVVLLLSLGWVMKLTVPWFHVGPFEGTGKNLILLGGGLFLMWKSVHEIHHKLEGHEDGSKPIKAAGFAAVIGQIMVLDIVFSLDSVITAVGMAKQIEVMVAAVIIAVGVMMAFANSIGTFVERHPSIKMLALAFLILIGINLVAESFHVEIPKGYTYFAMAFATVVELLNIRVSRGKPVKLHGDPSIVGEPDGSDPADH
ncbi:MAG: TerC family protein [Armatimonadetes bacterium]|nr:TerC family protein [Armatimonadota bacterium]MBX3109825.1 TerC family protein [Fimbriimonadaceae bacterium]